MNFGEQLYSQDGKQFPMNNTWVPNTPEKLIQVRSNPVSDWAMNQMKRVNYQEFPVPGSDYRKDMLQRYHGPDQNVHLMGQTGQTGEHNNFGGNSANRKSVLNHIASSYTQAGHYDSTGLNSNTLELLLKKNATNIASTDRNLDASINMAARNPLLPKFYPQASNDESDSYAGVQRCNIHPASDIVYKEANRLLIPNRNSEFSGSNSGSLLNNDIYYSVSNELKGIFPEIPYGDSYPGYNLNYAPIAEADATASFTNFRQSIPKTTDQLKFVDHQFCAMLDYQIAESTSQEKDKQEDLVSSTENEIQEYCDGLLQQVVESSSAAITTPYGDQKDSVSNICDKGSDQGFDLNKTPEQKAPKRKKHRPKVIVEDKPKRNPNPATQKTRDNPRKKRKNVPKAAATPQADVIKETFDSTVATRKSCKKALNFDLEKGGYERQSRMASQQEIHHRTEKAFNTTSDYKGKEMLGEANMKYDRNSALLISQQDELTVENQQPRNTDGITLLLNENVTNPLLSKRKSTIALSATTEEQQIAIFPVTAKGPAQGNSGSHQERNNGCKQQYINANEIGNILFQSETRFENSQKTKELNCQNTLQLVPNILSNSIEAKRSKRKYCNSTENQHDSATNPLGTSLCQEILQVDGNFKDATLAEGFLENKKRKKTQNRFHAKLCGRSSNHIMPNGCIESNRFVEQLNNRASTGDCFSTSGEPHQLFSTLIDEIICKLNGLNLNESNISQMEGHKALVPYKGDGSIVPYQEIDFSKKHKLRPKVDLDPETERTWKLLMGKEVNERLEEIDEEKEKWWEEERNVFRGRVDSFIARMHLVQGDRRFSKWKGSVVDSVIGVFLTQNVSDHLSSSAFMSLAARFPLKSKSSKRSYDVVATDILVEEPELSVVNPADTIIPYGRETLNQPTYYLGFEAPHHTRELWRENESSRINESLLKPNIQSSEEEFLSSQDSLDSSIAQDTRIRSSAGFNSESEGLNSGCEPSKAQFLTSTNSSQVGKTTLFQEFYNSVNGVSLFEERNKDGKLQQAEHVKQNSRVGRNNSHRFHSAFSHPSSFGYQQKQLSVASSTDYELNYSYTQGLKSFQMNGKEFSWPENVSLHSKFQDNNYRRFGNREKGDSADKPTEMQYGNGTLGSPELPPMNPYGPLSKHSVFLQDTSQSRFHTNHNQTSSNHHHIAQKTLESEGRPCAESLTTPHILDREQDGVVNDYRNIPENAKGFDSEKIMSAANRQVCSDNNRAEPKTQEQVYSPDPKDKESKLKVPKARKPKPTTEKKHVVDWDKLRKEVQENGTKEERSKDTMDSLDYEAVRRASIEEIAEPIKERGMHILLAGRIKEFLNRLVKEHGSIDLEWLRHVPPDKAKDYLLSIQGLGLKSVECVRLLTLHHLAFPVDTNVGRIAVRLGWVPIRPLPETLHIHLLEFAGVSSEVSLAQIVQLDQGTLYELHYQLITFGKVFCTKKNPNCNACPMRAECRHFASAFASARLAFPGPEEKRIVSMPVPIEAGRNPYVNMNPMMLTLPENNLIKEGSPESGQCEPIIEEPLTPEQQSTEALESDIEDFCRKDLDEIPNIIIDLKLMAKNVQSCLQYKENHEVEQPRSDQPRKHYEATESSTCLYELPDSHPLLEKMGKREPDDPTPYLLAIWTPGETAYSIEPPERRCESQDSTNLCNDQTCFSCNSIREANSQTVRGTLLIPCRTATRGSFPLNGTTFKLMSVQPIDIPREWIWNLPRRTVYFGTSVSSFSKVSQLKKFSIAFGEDLFVSGDLINKNEHLVLF
ncbi:Permuted single zf-CXXC unit [Sesbania bispinosa]|nr:Permuted single zf-CXXC unit [Sesbania bispinosa]